MKDERYWPVLGTWLKDTAKAPPDPRQTARRVAERLPETTQLRRQWWLPSPRHILRAPADVRPASQPSSIPATNGHTPTVIGRTQSMLSPAKAITVAALVFALGGAMLIAQPFDRQASVPGATTDDPAMAPSFFTVVTNDWISIGTPVTERRDDGVIDGTGEISTFTWDANDPRITGTATMTINETDYRQAATNLSPTGDVGSMRSGLLRIVNDGGSWEGPFTFLVLENAGVERNSIAGWLTGSDSYAGLSAYVVSPFEDGTFWGHITAAGPPPTPESLPE